MHVPSGHSHTLGAPSLRADLASIASLSERENRMDQEKKDAWMTTSSSSTICADARAHRVEEREQGRSQLLECRTRKSVHVAPGLRQKQGYHVHRVRHKQIV